MIDDLSGLSPLLPYIKVFFLLLGGGVGLPIPEDLALLVAGGFVSTGDAHALPMGLICYGGVLIGDFIIYRAGHLAGPRILRRRWIRKKFTAQRLRWIRENLEKRSFITIFISRHLFYLRTATFLVSGAVRMDFKKFIICDALAALVTVPLMMSLGYLGTEHFDEIMRWMNKIKILVGIVIGILVFSFIYYRHRRSSQ